jgi:putative phage-type endonuclease
MRLNYLQGSDEWLSWRSTIITASDAAIIMNANPWKTKEQLRQEKLAIIDPEPPSPAMLKGIELEPIARNLCCELFDKQYEPACFISDKHPFMGASMDAVTSCNKHAIEIKCGKKAFQIAEKGEDIPEYYMWQMQHQMYVLDIESMFYFCYWEGEYILTLVEADSEKMFNLIDECQKFYKSIQPM